MLAADGCHYRLATSRGPGSGEALMSWHRRAQDAARGRLHEAAAAGLIDGFVHAYLGMADERLPVPVADLIPGEAVRSYPTNFRAMAQDDIDAISLRGEQLTRTLLSHYCPELLAQEGRPRV